MKVLLLFFGIFSLSAFGQCGALGKMIINPRTHMSDCTPSVIADTIANIPAICTIGQVYFATDATAGKNLYACTATNTWTAPGSGSGTVTSAQILGTALQIAVTGTCTITTTGTCTLSVPSSPTFPGTVTAGNSFVAGNASSFIAPDNGAFYWNSRSVFESPSDGTVTLHPQAGAVARFQMGGTTASFPALKRSTTNLRSALADDSADTGFFASAFAGGGGTPSVGTCGAIVAGSTNTAGRITTVTGACTPIITFSGFTATTDWSCSFQNGTTPANVFVQTGVASTTTATATGVSAANDVLRYQCHPY